MERKVEIGCNLFLKAKGLNLIKEQDSCPIEDYCTRSVCVYLSDIAQLQLDQRNPKYIKNTQPKENGK